MPHVDRADNYLNEFIEELDQHFEVHKGNRAMAYASLSKAENEFINGEIDRCIVDVRYYLENYHCIKTEYQGIRTLAPMWDSQEIFLGEVFYLQNEGRQAKLIVLKARQLGLSTLTQGLMFHRTIFVEAANSMIVAQDPGQADYLFGMSRLAFDRLPWWMKPEERYEAKGRYLQFDRKDKLERMTNPGLGSGIYVEAANKMTGVSVGKTIRTAHLSEISDWGPMAGQILSTQIEPTMNAPDLLAVMESTARGKQGLWYRKWKQSIEGKGDWRPVFIEWFRVRKYSIPVPEKETFVRTEEEAAICQNVEAETSFKISDAGLNWRRNKIANFIADNGDEWLFYQEYPLNWREAFQASGICAFNKRKLHEMSQTRAQKPKWYGEITLNPKTKNTQAKLKILQKGEDPPVQEGEGGRFYLWEPPDPTYKYYVGADVAHGLEGGDFSVAQVIKIGRKAYEPDVQVAEWRGWINPTPYAYVLAGIATWYNKAEIACEVNDIGRPTNNELFRVIEYENMFQYKHYDKVKNFVTDYLGWQTNHKTRPEIISKFREAVDDGTLVLRSEALIDEAMSFSSLEGSRFEGQDTNDDRIMAMMICYYCAHDMDWGVQRDLPKDAPKDDVYRTFANQDYSPIYDKPNGIRHDMVVNRKIPAEVVMYDSITSTRGNVDDADLWKLM